MIVRVFEAFGVLEGFPSAATTRLAFELGWNGKKKLYTISSSVIDHQGFADEYETEIEDKTEGFKGTQRKRWKIGGGCTDDRKRFGGEGGRGV